MSRRLDIELTSSRDDNTWTWRAAGAKQPKGVLEASLLPPGAKVGDVLRVDAEFEIEGINVVNVLPPKGPRAERERIEIQPSAPVAELVTTTWVPKSERPRPPRRDERPRRDGGPARREGGPPRREGGPPRRDERPRGDRRPPQDRTERGPRPDRAPGDRPARPAGDRPSRPAGDRPARGPGDRARREPAPAAPPKPKPKRLNPQMTHRNAVLEALAPEERAVAEQVLRGGIAAVRQAVEAQNAARPEGEPAIRPEPLVGLAEELLPRLKTAEWRDRAEAAVGHLDDISIRDLRSVVAGADAAARDDETRLLASKLREALDRRLKEQQDTWVQEMTKSLEDARLVRALRISSRPPEPGTRLPAELAVRLTEAAGAAMAPDSSPERWTALLEAVAASPVRRTVKPVGLPSEPGEALLQMAKQTAGRVPALAALLGIDMPPPPGPARPPRPRPPKPVAAPPRAEQPPVAAQQPVTEQPPVAAQQPVTDAQPVPAESPAEQPAETVDQ